MGTCLQHAYQACAGYGQILPSVTSPLHPTSFEGWFFTAYAGALAVLVALPWAIRRLAKFRDPLPLLMLGSGLITSLGEPQLDFVSHLRWANNLPGPAFTAYGLHVPALIPPCYMLFMGLEAYWLFCTLQRGITVKQFAWVAFFIGLSDAIMENPGLLMHTYQYYGNQPFKFGDFVYYYAFTNSAAICTIAVMAYFLWPRVRGKGWLTLAILPLGIIGTTIGEFGTGFPTWLAINSQMATWLQWVVGSLTLILACVWIRVLAELTATAKEPTFSLWALFKERLHIGGRARTPSPITGQPGIAHTAITPDAGKMSITS
ncbi:MAG TPA: hypothetical protein VG223_06500 [Solirubrobacteraceae bacterium]|nr:hypothetical protein [Solirubrobacteraceae bacterium]